MSGTSGLIDFSVNVSPVELPLPDFQLSASAIGSYPSVDGLAIREFYAARFGLDREGVLALNGAIEGIYLLPRALGLRRVLIPSPSFFDYGRSCRLAGAEVADLPLDASSGFAFPDFGAISASLEGCDALFTATPNNPTGTMIPKEQLLALLCRFPEKIFIVDEAFIQFTEEFPVNSLMPETGAFRNLVVLHSLTKFYALPGLRLGAIIAHPDLVERLFLHKEPWTVNVFAEMVARHLLSCGEYEREVRALVTAQRRIIAEALAGNPAFELFGGSANFFLAGLNPGYDLDQLIEFLGARGIVVRDCRNFAGSSREFFRFSVRAAAENRQLIKALQLFGELPEGAAA
jgi:L-threonine-O-3-phosphate decarboxylase